MSDFSFELNRLTNSRYKPQEPKHINRNRNHFLVFLFLMLLIAFLTYRPPVFKTPLDQVLTQAEHVARGGQ